LRLFAGENSGKQLVKIADVNHTGTGIHSDRQANPAIKRNMAYSSDLDAQA
jgi:hypothetical protein